MKFCIEWRSSEVFQVPPSCKNLGILVARRRVPSLEIRGIFIFFQFFFLSWQLSFMLTRPLNKARNSASNGGPGSSLRCLFRGEIWEFSWRGRSRITCSSQNFVFSVVLFLFRDPGASFWQNHWIEHEILHWMALPEALWGVSFVEKFENSPCDYAYSLTEISLMFFFGIFFVFFAPGLRAYSTTE